MKGYEIFLMNLSFFTNFFQGSLDIDKVNSFAMHKRKQYAYLTGHIVLHEHMMISSVLHIFYIL